MPCPYEGERPKITNIPHQKKQTVTPHRDAGSALHDNYRDGTMPEHVEKIHEFSLRVQIDAKSQKQTHTNAFFLFFL